MSNPWVPFYPGDYDRDTKFLTMLQDAAYFRLLRHAWSTGEAIPDHRTAYRIVGAFEDASAYASAYAERDAVDFVLEKFFEKTQRGFLNKRAVKIYEEQQEKSLKRSQAANSRWNKEKSKHASAYANEHALAYANEHASAYAMNMLPEPELDKEIPPTPLGGKRPKKTIVPKDWRPSESFTAWLANKHPETSAAEMESELEKFKDYSEGNGKRYESHEAAFRNWMSSEFRKKPGNTNYIQTKIPQNGGKKLYGNRVLKLKAEAEEIVNRFEPEKRYKMDDLTILHGSELYFNGLRLVESEYDIAIPLKEA